MAYGTKALFDEIRILNFSSITSTYLPVGDVLSQHARIVTFTNSTDVPLYFSLNGVDDQIVLLPDTYKTYNLSTNKIRDDGLFIPVGTFFYTKEVLVGPTSGDAYIEVVFGSGGI